MDGYRQDTGRRVGPPTVCRALEFLVRQGRVTRIESRNTFAPCAHPERPHHFLFLLCGECGHSAERENAEVERLLAAEAARLGHRVSGHRGGGRLPALCSRGRVAAAPQYGQFYAATLRRNARAPPVPRGPAPGGSRLLAKRPASSPGGSRPGFTRGSPGGRFSAIRAGHGSGCGKLAARSARSRWRSVGRRGRLRHMRWRGGGRTPPGCAPRCDRAGGPD